MPTLIGLPIIALAVIVQSAILSQIRLLNGTADLVLLVVVSWIMNERVKVVWGWGVMAGLAVGYVSELPFWTPLGGYLIVVAVGILLKQRVWRVPVLALFAVVFAGTLVMHTTTFVVLRLSGLSLNPIQVFNLITLPGTLLNLLLAIPVQGMISEIAYLLYPEDIRV